MVLHGRVERGPAGQDGVQGPLDVGRASPLPPWAYFAGRMVATTSVAVAGAAATLAVSAIAYHVRPDPADALGLLVVLVVGTMCVAALGTAATAAIPTAESAQPVLSLTFYPLALLSGALGGGAGGSGRLLSLLPVQPMIDAAARALRHGTGGLPPTGDLAALAGWAAVGLVVSLLSFRWTPS